MKVSTLIKIPYGGTAKSSLFLLKSDHIKKLLKCQVLFGKDQLKSKIWIQERIHQAYLVQMVFNLKPRHRDLLVTAGSWVPLLQLLRLHQELKTCLLKKNILLMASSKFTYMSRQKELAFMLMIDSQFKTGEQVWSIDTPFWTTVHPKIMLGG